MRRERATPALLGHPAHRRGLVDLERGTAATRTPNDTWSGRASGLPESTHP
ncbi:hypothetical protein OG871_06820 [Kitasatospora sp. NBC_00374]|uniref:hypothetical protein n=1 Tax=Kitasatospora sp. NBC_00374 TaxID=2975964 RepID=UPI0032485A7E